MMTDRRCLQRPGRARRSPWAALCGILTALIVTLPLAAPHSPAPPHEYILTPIQVATDSYVVVGRTEDFSPANGGNIVNTAFVVTGNGVVVIDTGPTRRYGEALRDAIRQVTDEPIREVWLTHHHPDHILGNQAFSDVPIAALPATAQGIQAEGDAFAANVYRMVGDWAKGTEPVAATRTLTAGMHTVGRHRFRLLALHGHTEGDLAILDESTGVLFAGDLLFHDRAPTTPHADIASWLRAIDTLTQLAPTVVVPGHGAPVKDAQRLRPVEQTRQWLTWLQRTLTEAADSGLDPAEIAARPVPAELATMARAREELARSLAHVYRRMESRAVVHNP